MPNLYRIQGWVKTTLGPAVAGANIYWLDQPANTVAPITPPRTTPVVFVPNPQQQLFSDPEGNTPVSQPLSTDGQGYFFAYCLPGVYTLLVQFSGSSIAYPDQSVGNVGSSGGTTIALETNGSPNFNQNRLNIQQGAGIVLLDDNYGNLTITSTGGGGGVAVEVNGIPLSSPALLNLENSPTVLFTDAGAGVVTAYAVPNVSILPTPDVKRFAMWESATGQAPFSSPFGVDPWILTGDQQTGTDSGASQASISATVARNQAVQFTCTLFQLREYLGNQVFWAGRNNTFLSRLEVNYDSVSSDGKNYWGLCDLDFLGTGPDPTPGNFIGFTTNHHVSDPFASPYFCEVWAAGSNVFSFATAIIVAAGVAHDFKTQTIGSTVTFFIDGAAVAFTSVALPTVPLGLYIGEKSRTGLTGPNVNIIVEYLYNEVQNIQ